MNGIQNRQAKNCGAITRKKKKKLHTSDQGFYTEWIYDQEGDAKHVRFYVPPQVAENLAPASQDNKLACNFINDVESAHQSQKNHDDFLDNFQASFQAHIQEKGDVGMIPKERKTML